MALYAFAKFDPHQKDRENGLILLPPIASKPLGYFSTHIELLQ